jgi:hypothetical protein
MKPGLLAQSHRLQFEGGDFQSVAVNIAGSNGIEYGSDDYAELESAPDPECGCGFCATAEWME